MRDYEGPVPPWAVNLLGAVAKLGPRFFGAMAAINLLLAAAACYPKDWLLAVCILAMAIWYALFALIAHALRYARVRL